LGPGFRLEEPQPNDVRHWVERGLSNSPQVAAQRYALDIAGEEIKRSHYGHYPTLDAVASYGRNNAGSGILGGVGYDITTKVVGVQVAVPIYQGGSITSKTREAAANQGKAREELETISRQIAFVVEQAFASVASGVEQVQSLRAALASTEKQVHATQIGRNEGARSSIDLLNAQQQLFQSRKDLAQAQYNYLMNRLRLRAAAGEIGEDDIVRVNSMLAIGQSPAGLRTDAPRVYTPPAVTVRSVPNGVPSASSSKRQARGSAARMERTSGLLLSTELGSGMVGATFDRAESRHAARGAR
jgi:outer membrane protein TolC